MNYQVFQRVSLGSPSPYRIRMPICHMLWWVTAMITPWQACSRMWLWAVHSHGAQCLAFWWKYEMCWARVILRSKKPTLHSIRIAKGAQDRIGSVECLSALSPCFLKFVIVAPVMENETICSILWFRGRGGGRTESTVLSGAVPFLAS